MKSDILFILKKLKNEKKKKKKATKIIFYLKIYIIEMGTSVKKSYPNPP